MIRLHSLPVKYPPCPNNAIGRAWPCHSADQLGDLQQIAELYGCRVTQRELPTAQFPQIPAARVAGIGDVGELAHLYAVLTGRTYRQFDTPQAAVADPAVEIIVTTSASLPHPLLDALAWSGRNTDIGILWAPDTVSLERQVLIRSAAAVLTPVADRSSLLITPLSDARGPRHKHGTLVEIAVTQAEDLHGHAVLGVTTHSDGIDAFLSPDLTLCALADHDPERQGGRPPKCILTRNCHRHGISVADALDSSKVVSAAKLSARVLVWNACLGIMGDADGVTDHWGLLNQLVSSPTIGAVIVMRGIIHTAPDAIVPLVEALNTGLTVAAALGMFVNRLHGTTYAMLRERSYIFGDPAAVAQPPTTSDNLSSIPTSTLFVAPTPRLQSAEGVLIRHFLETLTTSLDFTEDAERALEALCAFERRCAMRVTAEQYIASATLLRHCIIQVIAQTNWSTWLETWLRLAALRHDLGRKKCRLCGGAAWAGIFQPRAPGSQPRYFANCARCAATDDRPISCFAEIQSTTSGLRLLHGGPTSDWTGAVISAVTGQRPTWLLWPEQQDGRPCAEVEVTHDAHSGPVFRSALFIQDWRISLHMRRTFID